MLRLLASLFTRKPSCTCVLKRDESFPAAPGPFGAVYRVDDTDCPRHGERP